MPGAGPGTALREFRRRAGLTQQEVADLAGLSVAGLRDIEQGRVVAPRAQTLRRLGIALGLSAAEAEHLAGRGNGGSEPARVWIGVLGPLTVRVDGAEVDPGSEVQRVLLGLLALSPNVPVARERLFERAAAAGRAPTTAGGLAARMSRLRRRLRPQPPDGARPPDGAQPPAAAAPELVASAGGYGLAVAADQLDLLTFQSLASRARRHRAAGELPRACELFAEAVGVWRGEPLAGLSVLAVDPAVVGLVRQWRSVVTDYAVVAAELGRHDEVVPLLRRVVAAEPLHEVAHARLMVALAGAGQQGEALVVFDDLRRRLDRDLGIPPGPELVEAHRRVLRQEVARARRAPHAPAHRTLPADIADFTGRRAELHRLRAHLAQAGPGPQVIAIEGMPGVGKTRLAVHLAHQVVAAGQYAQQQLYADLAGYAGPAPAVPAAVLASFLHLLGVPGDRLPAEPAGRAALYQERLRDREALVLLDDAASAGQVASLLPGGARSLVLVTSRRRLELTGAYRLPLDVFTGAEARELLAAVLGEARVDRDRAASQQVVDWCGRLPLAVGLVARRLQARPAWTLAEVATRLADPGRRWDELRAGARSVRAAFDASYQALPAGVRDHLRLLATQPDQDLTAVALAARAGCPPAAARRTLDHLLREHLVSASGPDRYRVPLLVRDYIREVSREAW